jgi:uncharacterized membrane protein YhaH (DUF805 family)
MFLKNARADNGYAATVSSSRRSARWWAIPSAGTVAFLLVAVTGVVKTQSANAHGMGPHEAGAVIGFYIMLIGGTLALCGTWAAAASRRSRSPARTGSRSRCSSCCS